MSEENQPTLPSSSEGNSVSPPRKTHFNIWFIVVTILILITVTVVLSKVAFNQKEAPSPKNITSRSVTTPPILQEALEEKPLTATPTLIPKVYPDNADTLSNPTKEATIDPDHYLIVGLPSGQNNKETKKIIFSLPGHGSTAEEDYEAWKKHIVAKGDYGLVSINWWSGEGEKKSDYYSPVKIVEVVEHYLKNNNYSTTDFIVLEGFSRGSANTYSVIANDRFLKKNLIDAVISASGKYQSDFAMTEELLQGNSGKPFSGVKWVLVCGAKDPNPTRDGCEGMSETEKFLKEKGAAVLLFLQDPNGAHGAFHMSPLNFPEQALQSFDLVL